MGDRLELWQFSMKSVLLGKKVFQVLISLLNHIFIPFPIRGYGFIFDNQIILEAVP